MYSQADREMLLPPLAHSGRHSIFVFERGGASHTRGSRETLPFLSFSSTHLNASHTARGRNALSGSKAPLLAYEGAEIDVEETVVFDESGHLIEDTVSCF